LISKFINTAAYNNARFQKNHELN